MKWTKHGCADLWTAGAWSIERFGDRFELFEATEVPYTPKFGGMPTTIVRHNFVAVFNTLREAKKDARFRDHRTTREAFERMAKTAEG